LTWCLLSLRMWNDACAAPPGGREGMDGVTWRWVDGWGIGTSHSIGFPHKSALLPSSSVFSFCFLSS
jgi:hypothetical protein